MNALALLPSVVLLLPSGVHQERPASSDGYGFAAPEGLTRADWTSIEAAFDTERYAACPVEGGYVAYNPGQGWRTRFEGRGFLTKPDTGTWTWGLELESYGFGDAQQEVTRPNRVSAEGGRVAYEWDATLEEWYVNDARGLEHGYTVHRRPHHDQESRLTFTLTVRGELRAEVADDGRGMRFLDPCGLVELTYTGLSVIDADGRDLDARLEDGGDRLSLSIDERGARYPLTIDPIAQQAYLKASNPDADDRFGYSVAVSDDTVVVGARFEQSNATGVNGNQGDNSVLGAGAAYVFVRSGTGWSQQAYLKASNTDPQDRFGASVAVSGDTIVVGAWLESSNATGVNGGQNNNNAFQSGAAYVFVRNGTSWTQQAYLKASNTGASDHFGRSVAISGDTVVVGAADENSAATGVNGNENDNSTPGAGAAYVFVRNGSSWSQEAYLKASNTEFNDLLGVSVAVAGDTIVVGAPGEDSNATGVNGNQSDNSANGAGAVYVFARIGTSWSQQAYLKASNADADDLFGIATAVAGDTIVVGAWLEDSNAIGVNGNQGDNSATGAGAAYVFVRSGATWSQEAYLKASNTEFLDGFGGSVGVSGERVVIGGRFEDSNSTGVNGYENDNSALGAGAAYVYERSGTSWSQEAYLKASNADTDDSFGYSVAISGNTVVVGAPVEDSNATGVNGSQADNNLLGAGAAYVFGSSAWTTFRNSGSNPASYSASAPVLGSMWTATVDLTTTGHSLALIRGFTSPAALTLAGGQAVLVSGAQRFKLGLQPGPQAMWSAPVPNDPSLACVTLYTQAIHLSGVAPFALSNAQDLFVGY